MWLWFWFDGELLRACTARAENSSAGCRPTIVLGVGERDCYFAHPSDNFGKAQKSYPADSIPRGFSSSSQREYQSSRSSKSDTPDPTPVQRLRSRRCFLRHPL